MHNFAEFLKKYIFSTNTYYFHYIMLYVHLYHSSRNILNNQGINLLILKIYNEKLYVHNENIVLKKAQSTNTR